MKFDSEFLVQFLIPAILVPLLFGALVSYVAYTKGRSPYLWFCAGLFITWIALIIVFIMKPKQELEEIKQVQAEDKVEEVIQAPVELPKVWFYLDRENKQHGPITIAELQELSKNETISESTFLWKEGMGGWKRLRELPDLKLELK